MYKPRKMFVHIRFRFPVYLNSFIYPSSFVRLMCKKNATAMQSEKQCAGVTAFIHEEYAYHEK